jgi:hypothetical protein
VQRPFAGRIPCAGQLGAAQPQRAWPRRSCVLKKKKFFKKKKIAKKKKKKKQKKKKKKQRMGKKKSHGTRLKRQQFATIESENI